MGPRRPSLLRQPIPFLIQTSPKEILSFQAVTATLWGGGLYQGLCVTKKHADPTSNPPPSSYSILVTFLEYAKRRRRRNHSTGLAPAKSC